MTERFPELITLVMDKHKSDYERPKAIIYARVSTKDQDADSQKRMGIKKARELGYKDEDMFYIVDHGVSARKKTFNQRSGLDYALKLIRDQPIGHFIVRDRDRLARKMVEYLLLYKTIRQAGVNLVLSDTDAVKVSDDFGNEAIHALMAEIDGDTIVHRTKMVSRYYPSAPLGYKKVGTKSSTRYEQTADLDTIKELFIAFEGIDSAERYKLFRRKWKQRIDRYPESILCNGVYGGVLIEGSQIIDYFKHIVPIVNAADIITNREKLAQWGFIKPPNTADEAVMRTVPECVYCAQCRGPLKRTLRKENAQYSCSTCRKVKIAETQLRSYIEQTVSDLLLRLNKHLLQGLTLTRLKEIRLRERKRLEHIRGVQLDLRTEVLDRIDLHTHVQQLMDREKELQREIDELYVKLRKLDGLITTVSSLVSLIQQQVVIRGQTQFTTVSELLIKQVLVDVSVVHVIHRFKEFLSEE